MRLLELLLRTRITSGTLRVTDWKGRVATFGDGEPVVAVRIHDSRTLTRLVLDPQLALGEAFMEGSLTMEQGDVYDLLDLVLASAGWSYPDWSSIVGARLRGLLRRAAQFNPAERARRNVAAHYDLTEEFFRLFLDEDMQYSCAYFLSPEDTLEQAQQQKKRHIAAKLLLKPGQRVLDIGSGWGGLALTLNAMAGVDVTGLTLSERQAEVARERARVAGREDEVRFLLQDYRAATGSYDRIVSVGMFEHVGVNHYGTYFRAVRDLLKEDGVAVVHAIGRADGPGSTNPWIARYIFPGGYSPALSEVVPWIERAGLHITDIEILRLHYAETLRQWRRRFLARRDVAAKLYDERFCRMWEFYLAACEATFRHAGHMVFQIQMARRIDAVPLTRDYIGEAEKRLAGPRARASKSVPKYA
ncbi:cyclopropane-fatty-acyl-phospholipid synthase family protein [Alsobacter sp. SYSU M60028]|uniref:Cyclopropane-fatty-acyl-phospholipid synthase family protein n=1 Tax=Alsobacter ponti TaxID=2962936 RepID=A0ABT1LJI5_9HYPH|nr:cyclopropane-fatty-acyl-phospholipid synthase family protein [Alsobacter ponti]MCP8940895.1 cyclopropane-fatty-acyl-phospholipid synthase family protein [Alsobacter ponti]